MASDEFLDQLGFGSDKHVFDVRCGLGGAARLVVTRYGRQVPGINLTSEYVETRQTLCTWGAGSAYCAPSMQRTGDGGCRQPFRWGLCAARRYEFLGQRQTSRSGGAPDLPFNDREYHFGAKAP